MNNVGEDEDLLEIDFSTDSDETKQDDEGSAEGFLEQRNSAEAESPDIVPYDEKNNQEKDANKMLSAEATATEDEPGDNSEGDLNESYEENMEELNDKQDVDLPDVVPERSETPGISKQEEVSSLSNADGEANCNNSGTLRSILKRDNNKKNLHVSFSDTPVIHNEATEPISSLISLMDSSFDIKVEENFWNDFDKTKKEDDDCIGLSGVNLELSGCTKESISRDNLLHLEHINMDGNNLDSDSETNSSQDTVILMTTEENKRNQEAIQQSQRRFQLQKHKSDYDSPPSRMCELKSNSAVRKCLERTALRRSLTQCANTRRKTQETKPSNHVPSSVMEKLRLLTRDPDDGRTSGEVGAAMNSLPRLDLQQVHEMINTRCPLKDVYSTPKQVDVPGDVREWKMSSKLWDDSMNDDPVNDNNDELEKFVQQDWERIERVRQRYTPEQNDPLMELCRRPSVKGIRPRFGSTHQIINQLQQQRQPPPFKHESLSNINCIDPSKEFEYTYGLHPKLSQSFQSLDESKWPLYVTLASSNPNRLSCPPGYFQPDTQFSPDYMQNSNRLSSCESTTRFVSDV